MATVAVETLDKLEKRVTLNIPKSEVQSEVEKRLKIRARTAKAPGFRPGKVPLKMVAQQYGYQVESEVLNEKVSSAFNDIAIQNDLRVVGQPRFEAKKEENGAADMLAVDATFEVFPEVKVGDLSSLELEKATCTITEAEVEKTIDILRKQRAHYHARGEQSDHGDGGPDTSAQDGDRVTVDFVGRMDGVEFEGGKGEDFPFVLGEGRMLPEFEAAARGMKAGESKTFPLTFPEDYHGKDVAGKTAEFTLTMKKVEWSHLPEVDYFFAQSVGIANGDVEQLYRDIENNILREVKGRLAAINKNKAMDAILEISEFDVPKVMVEHEVDQLIEMANRDMAANNLNPQGVNLPRGLFTGKAERRVRLGMVLSKIMKDNDIKATPEMMRAKAEELASSYEQPEMVRDYYLNDSQRRSELEALVTEDSVIDYIYSLAKVTEKPTTFDELMAQKA